MLPQMRTGDILCFWTKAPSRLAEMYRKPIQDLQANGMCVLAQVTMNFYGMQLEPGVTQQDITPLAELIGANHIRLRFDPIIPGFTTLDHFQQCLDVARQIQTDRITVNFIAGQYPAALQRLSAAGQTGITTDAKKILFLRKMQQLAGDIRLAVCAESNALAARLPGILPARCADPDWAAQFGFSINGGHASRKGCGCFYTQNIRIPGRCVHGCIYCYANKQ